MTTEPTVPQPDLGSAPANGQGQSQGHRRRRRRRKNKSNQPGGQPQAQQQNPPQQNPPQQAQPQMQAPQQPQQQGGPPKQGSGRHRKKKKFFQQKSSAPQPGPGNSIAPQHNGRRKDRQKGPRMFVGPMDHSYRIVNGNVADGPPSTIPTSRQWAPRQLLR